MIRCKEALDRLVSITQQPGEGLDADLRNHLARCSTCALEWELVRAARGIVAPSGALDVRAVSRRVLMRLAGARPAARTPSRRVVYRVMAWASAAAVLLALGLGALVQGEPAVGPAPLEAVSILPEIGDLGREELSRLLAVFPSEAPLSRPLGTGLSDLSDEELGLLLLAMEG